MHKAVANRNADRGFRNKKGDLARSPNFFDLLEGKSKRLQVVLGFSVPRPVSKTKGTVVRNRGFKNSYRLLVLRSYIPREFLLS